MKISSLLLGATIGTALADSQMAGVNAPDRSNTNAKIQQLEEESYFDPSYLDLTSSLGVAVEDNQNTLKAGGARGPQLLADFLFRDKLTAFDRERIPERVVHARGFGAHGVFRPYPGNEKYTTSKVFTNTSHETPMFARISNVQGFRGSADNVRDVHGFALKFYTEEGNWDLVGNDIPVFFMQDGTKFFDFIHALKPEPHNEIPQGQSAHDTFWDYIGLNTDSAFMSEFIMSDRGITRNIRAINGYGVHTFRWVNAEGKSWFVKYIWKNERDGNTQLVWDEATTLQGKDPDFNRRDLWNAINSGHDYPKWIMYVQLFTEEDAENWDFDHLDATKLIPEELVPLTPVGEFVLNRNVEDYHAETEQISFSPANIVPGMDFSNDPLLQGRLFAYTDTALYRLGTVNFNQIPINRPLCPFASNRRGGFAQQRIVRGEASYEPNSVDNGWPRQALHGFHSFPQNVSGPIVRERPPSFSNHFSQAQMYWNSLAPYEQKHTINGYSFELSKVMRPHIRQRVVDRVLQNINDTLAESVAQNLGLQVNTTYKLNVPAPQIERAANISFESQKPQTIAHNQIAILVHEGANGDNIKAVQSWATANGAVALVLNQPLSAITTAQNYTLQPDARRDGQGSVTVDAVVVADGNTNVTDVEKDGSTKHYIREAYAHLKPIVFLGDRSRLIYYLGLHRDNGTYTAKNFADIQDQFKATLLNHRIWDREPYASTV